MSVNYKALEKALKPRRHLNPEVMTDDEIDIQLTHLIESYEAAKVADQSDELPPINKAISESWEKDCDHVADNCNLDDAYEAGFKAAWRYHENR